MKRKPLKSKSAPKRENKKGVVEKTFGRHVPLAFRLAFKKMFEKEFWPRVAERKRNLFWDLIKTKIERNNTLSEIKAAVTRELIEETIAEMKKKKD
ncbi:MAG: hypothetical protein Q7S21_04890 [archaeon]|nr:hypothetical protein [archaeon]